MSPRHLVGLRRNYIFSKNILIVPFCLHIIDRFVFKLARKFVKMLWPIYPILLIQNCIGCVYFRLQVVEKTQVLYISGLKTSCFHKISQNFVFAPNSITHFPNFCDKNFHRWLILHAINRFSIFFSPFMQLKKTVYPKDCLCMKVVNCFLQFLHVALKRDWIVFLNGKLVIIYPVGFTLIF